MSTPATRAAKRDYWNSARAQRLGRLFDRTMEVLAVTTILILGSLNF